MAGKKPTTKDNPVLLQDCKSLLESIQVAINGNGSQGLKAQMARTEATLAALADLVKSEAQLNKETRENLANLTLAVVKLEDTVADHVEKKHLGDLIQEKKFWVILILGYITLHIISTYVPVLWDLLMRVLGLPSLELPVQ